MSSDTKNESPAPVEEQRLVVFQGTANQSTKEQRVVVFQGTANQSTADSTKISKVTDLMRCPKTGSMPFYNHNYDPVRDVPELGQLVIYSVCYCIVCLIRSRDSSSYLRYAD